MSAPSREHVHRAARLLEEASIVVERALEIMPRTAGSVRYDAERAARYLARAIHGADEMLASKAIAITTQSRT